MMLLCMYFTGSLASWEKLRSKYILPKLYIIFPFVKKMNKKKYEAISQSSMCNINVSIECSPFFLIME